MLVAAIIMNSLYFVLMLYAVCNAKRIGFPNMLILGGVALGTVYMFLVMLLKDNWYWLEIAGMLLISAGALLNGKEQGKVHIQHHLIRGGFELLVVLLFVFG